MAYQKTVWEDLPSTNTPLSAANLQKIENELERQSINNIITVTLSSNFTIPTNGVTKVPLRTVSSSEGNKLNLNNNGEVVCTEDGKIKVSAFVTLDDLTEGGNTQIRLLKNDNALIYLPTRVGSTGEQSFSISSKLVSVTQGDTISLNIGNWTGNNNSVRSSDIYTYLTVEYVD